MHNFPGDDDSSTEALNPDSNHVPVMMLTAESGMGKSTLLAQVALQFQQVNTKFFLKWYNHLTIFVAYDMLSRVDNIFFM